MTPLSHKVVVQTQYRTNRRSARHALCVQVVRRGLVNDEYLRVSHVGSMRETIRWQVRRLLRFLTVFTDKFSFARGHDDNRKDRDNA